MSQERPRFASLQQALEAMTLIYNPAACPGLQATIQFDISGTEPGEYYLRIDDGECHFCRGKVEKPSIAIQTPSDVWMRIISGRLSGHEALMSGKYRAQGDFNLLQQWSAIFDQNGDQSMQAPAGQRPAGPLCWNGSTYMAAAFLPWIIHWIAFGSFGIPAAVSVGLPLLLSTALVVYRLCYNRPGWLELGGLAYFSAGAVMSLLQMEAFDVWAPVWSNLVMGLLWLASLLAGDEPLSMQYVKWNFARRLWRFSLFPYINAAISLVWGFQCVLAALLAGVAVLQPHMSGLFTALRFITLVPAYWFTSWYPQAGMRNPVKDVSKATGRLQVVSAAGAAVAVLLFAASLMI